ncbi:MAG: head GIN domain-containing protein [Ignavibacteriaceae bacterium]
MKKILFPLALLMFVFLASSAYAGEKTKTYSIKDFTGVSVGSGMHVTVTQSNNYSITITGDEKDFEDLMVEKRNGTLDIYYDRSGWGWFGHHRRGDVKVKITMPELTAIDLSGGAEGNISMNVDGKSFSAETSGGAELRGTLTCGNLNVETSGGSRIELSGKGKNLSADGSGGSKIKLKNFAVINVNADLSGGSTVWVNMDGTLNSDQSGGSRLYYYGNVSLGNTSFSGGAGVSRGD